MIDVFARRFLIANYSVVKTEEYSLRSMKEQIRGSNSGWSIVLSIVRSMVRSMVLSIVRSDDLCQIYGPIWRSMSALWYYLWSSGVTIGLQGAYGAYAPPRENVNFEVYESLKFTFYLKTCVPIMLIYLESLKHTQRRIDDQYCCLTCLYTCSFHVSVVGASTAPSRLSCDYDRISRRLLHVPPNALYCIFIL